MCSSDLLFHSLSRHLDSGALEELSVTTNGSQLARFADELRDCGVRRINVSLDTLDEQKFKAITRWGDLSKVMAGIDAAQKRVSRSRSTRWRSRGSTMTSSRASSNGRMDAAWTSPLSR